MKFSDDMDVVKESLDKVNELNVGDTLEVVSTDPGALNDIPAWCRINGHKVIETRDEDDEVFVVIEVCNA